MLDGLPPGAGLRSLGNVVGVTGVLSAGTLVGVTTGVLSVGVFGVTVDGVLSLGTAGGVSIFR